MARRNRWKVPKIGRDSVLFFAGLAGIYHEVVIAKVERPTILLLCATMVGLPAFLRSDEKGDKKDSGGGSGGT